MRIHKMVACGIEHIVNRTYNTSGAFQWARETCVNAIEAGATHIQFGFDTAKV